MINLNSIDEDRIASKIPGTLDPERPLSPGEFDLSPVSEEQVPAITRWDHLMKNSSSPEDEPIREW